MPYAWNLFCISGERWDNLEFISLKPLWWIFVIPILLIGWRYSLVELNYPRKLASFLFRVTGVLLLILALCRPFGTSDSQNLHVVFLVDVSQSVDLESVKNTADEIEKSINQLYKDDSFSLFAFAKGIQQLTSTSDLKKLVSDWQTEGADDQFRSETNIAEALLLSRISIPAGKAKRVVIYSDGMETSPEVKKALQSLANEQTDAYYVAMAPIRFPEASVVSIHPSTTRSFTGEVVRLQIETAANQNMEGELRIIHRSVAIQSKSVSLIANQNQKHYFDVDMVTPGNSRWTVELIPEQDHFPVNNQRTCTVGVRGKPRILILHEKTIEMRALQRAMNEQEF
ncbi:MAG: vWA domain-containing protein, partial [Planctomycetota bacterium]